MVCAVHGLYTPSWCWYRFPEIRTSSIDWAQLSRFHLKTETECSLRNVVFRNINRAMGNVKKHLICANVKSSQIFASYIQVMFAPHYEVFSNFLTLRPSWVQIFSSAPCSEVSSVYVPLLITEAKFHTLQHYRKNCGFIYSNFYIFVQQTRRQKVLN
jgi:hypothetical protein